MSIIDHILKEKASSVYFELSRMLDEKASEIASQYKNEFDKECFDDINESPLTGNQHKIDANKNGKLDAHDFKLLRAKNDKPPFDQPYSKTKVHKDEYGNVIRNVAKRLAKKGMAANEEMSPQEAHYRKRGFYSYALKAPTPAEAIGHAMNTITAKYAKSKKKTNEEADLHEMKTVTNRIHAKGLNIKIGDQRHAYKKYSWGLHQPWHGPLKDGNFNSKAEMKAAMEKHPSYNSSLREDSDLQELSKKKLADYLDKSQSGRQHPTPEKFRKSAKMATIAAKKIGKRFPGSGQVSVKVKATNEETVIDENAKAYDAHFDKQTDAVKNRLNLHMRNGLTYPEAVAKTRKVGSSVKGCTPLNEEVEDDGWYAHKEMHGKVSKEDWKKGWRYNKLRPKVPFYHGPTKTYHAKIKEEYMDEKTLTSAEMKKREEVVKTIERKKERKGYDPGADEAVYEDKTRVGTLAQRTQAYRDDKAKALKGKQHKLDKNKNGKLDAHDFKLLRKD